MSARFQVRSLTTSVFLPSLLFAVGRGAVTPVIALLALELGATPAMAGFVVALRGLGTMAFDIPAGLLVERVGDKRSMIIATAVLVGIAAAIAVRPSLWAYALLTVAMGATWAVWSLARLTYATEASPRGHRGRVMSMVGGMGNMGRFLGPLLGGASTVALGLSGPFIVMAVLAAGALLALWWAVPESSARREAPSTPIRTLLRTHKRAFTTAGMFVLAAQVVRSSRQVILPLWGDGLDLDAGVISFIFSASAAVEILIFYPVGILMDRKGRKWAAVPSMSVLALGVGAIPLTTDIVSLTFLGLVLGAANGFGTGINMTLGSDLSPSAGRSQFFGLWRFVTDAGAAGGPLVVSATTSLVSLSVGAWVVGVLGLVGVLVLSVAVPEPLHDDP